MRAANCVLRLRLRCDSWEHRERSAEGQDMNYARLIPRILLGLIFFVFGLNGLHPFMPQPQMSPVAGQFFGGMAATRYMIPLIFLTQVTGGILLLAGILVPLALLLLAPVILNIFLFHAFVAPEGLPVAIIVVALEVWLAFSYRDRFAPLFSS